MWLVRDRQFSFFHSKCNFIAQHSLFDLWKIEEASQSRNAFYNYAKTCRILAGTIAIKFSLLVVEQHGLIGRKWSSFIMESAKVGWCATTSSSRCVMGSSSYHKSSLVYATIMASHHHHSSIFRRGMIGRRWPSHPLLWGNFPRLATTGRGSEMMWWCVVYLVWW